MAIGVACATQSGVGGELGTSLRAGTRLPAEAGVRSGLSKRKNEECVGGRGGGSKGARVAGRCF